MDEIVDIAVSIVVVIAVADLRDLNSSHCSVSVQVKIKRALFQLKSKSQTWISFTAVYKSIPLNIATTSNDKKSRKRNDTALRTTPHHRFVFCFFVFCVCTFVKIIIKQSLNKIGMGC